MQRIEQNKSTDRQLCEFVSECKSSEEDQESSTETCLLKYASLPESGITVCDINLERIKVSMYKSQPARPILASCTTCSILRKGTFKLLETNESKFSDSQFRKKTAEYNKQTEYTTTDTQTYERFKHRTMKPRALVKKPTDLMLAVQTTSSFLLNESMEELVKLQCSEAIELKSTVFPGDRITIFGASALMIAAFYGNVSAVERLNSEMRMVSDNGWSALMLAAIEGHVQCIKLLIEEIDLCDFTMLMYAVVCNDYDRVKLLLCLAGKQFTLRVDRGLSALMLAVKLGHYKIALLLVDVESRLQTTNDWIDDYTALLFLAKYGLVELDTESECYSLMTTLLKQEAHLRSECGETALMVAAKAGNIELVRYICNDAGKWSSQLKAQTYDGKTALMYAAQRGCILISSFLVEFERQFTMNDGRTALMFASEYGYKHIAELLCQYESGMKLSCSLMTGKTALMFAAESGHTDIVELLVERERGMSMKDGTTALMLAAMNNHDTILNILHEEAGLKDIYGRSALIHAVQSNAEACVIVLSAWEAGMRDNYGNTALMYAARDNNIVLSSVLREYEICMVNSNGYSALMIASELGNKNVCKLLSEESGLSKYNELMYLVTIGADICEINSWKHKLRQQTSNGITSLMLAAINNNVSAIEPLIEEVGLQDLDGNTALMYASKKGFCSIVSMLAKYEAKYKNNSGMTALMFASYYGHLECVMILFEDEKDLTDNDGNDVSFYAKYPNHDNMAKREELLSFLKLG